MRDEAEEAQVLPDGAGAHEREVQTAVGQVRGAAQPRSAHVAAAGRHNDHHRLELALRGRQKYQNVGIAELHQGQKGRQRNQSRQSAALGQACTAASDTLIK